MIPWLKLRFEERSSWTGIIIGVGALLFILGIHPLSTIIAWGALVWALYNFWKSE